MDLYKRIQDLKKQRKVRTATIAHALDMEQSNYVRVEKKGSKLTYEQIEGIAGALGISVKEFLFGENETLQTVNTKEIEDLRKENEINRKLLKDAISYILDKALINGVDNAMYSHSIEGLPSRDEIIDLIIKKYGNCVIEESHILGEYCDIVRKRMETKFNYEENQIILFYMFNSIEYTYDLEYLFNNGFVNDKTMIKIYTAYKKKQKEEDEKFRKNPPESLDFEM